MWWTLVTCYRILQKPISSLLTCFYSREQCAFLCEFNNATVIILITSPLSSCYEAVRGKLWHHYLSMGVSNSKALLLCTFCQTEKKPIATKKKTNLIFYWYQYRFHFFFRACLPLHYNLLLWTTKGILCKWFTLFKHSCIQCHSVFRLLHWMKIIL